MTIPEYVKAPIPLTCLLVGCFCSLVLILTYRHWFGWICLPLSNLCFFVSAYGFYDEKRSLEG
jgi:hypothetical protein